jgi:outer membrane protein assembly factor BamD
MRFRFFTLPLLAAVLVLGLFGYVPAQGGGRTQSDLSAVQRLDVMRSQLEALRRSLSSGIAGIPQKPAADKGKNRANADDPRVRLQGLDKEVSSILSEVNDLHAKADRSERYDATRLDGLETSVKEIETRVQVALTETAGARKGNDSAVASTSAPHQKKKNGHLFGLIGGGGGNNKYEEILGGPAPGRDRVLFEEAAKEVRKGNYDTGRLLFTTIITTYPDSPFLPMAKLAIADSFYLEGGTSSLIQAANSYQDWLAFFPTDPLADAAMLKVAEAEMRQMGLSDRDITHARKAEQRLKALLQQYPQTRLRPTVQDRLWEVQESLGMHNMAIGDFYREHYINRKGGLKGAQSRYKEIVDKYPCFSQTDKVLFNLAYTYTQEEEPDEAAKYYVQLLQNYPDSEYAEKAKEQLSIIGVPIPEKGTPNTCPKRERPSFIGNLMQQVAGSADVTVGKDGILISRSSKEGSDLIDQALKYNGQLPSNTMPKPQVQRSTPKQPMTPANDEQTAPEKKKIPLTIQATPNGPVPNPINPSTPPTNPTSRPPGTKP